MSAQALEIFHEALDDANEEITEKGLRTMTNHFNDPAAVPFANDTIVLAPESWDGFFVAGPNNTVCVLRKPQRPNARQLPRQASHQTKLRDCMPTSPKSCN